MDSEFRFSEAEYLALLELTYEVAQALTGKVSPDGRMPDSQHLALKLYTHGVSAHWLYQGSKSTVPASTGGSSFIDFSSIAVITRAALETYLTFFEVFVAPEDDDEFEFLYCLWHLSGHVIREGMVPLDQSLREDYEVAQEDIKALRDRMEATERYKALKPREKKNVLKGWRKRDWEAVAESAGFGLEFVRRLYAYYSGFAHADGLTAGLLMSAKTADDQRFHAQIHLVTIMIVLSKFILDYARLFEEASKVLPDYPLASDRARFWSEVISQIE